MYMLGSLEREIQVRKKYPDSHPSAIVKEVILAVEKNRGESGNGSYRKTNERRLGR